MAPAAFAGSYETHHAAENGGTTVFNHRERICRNALLVCLTPALHSKIALMFRGGVSWHPVAASLLAGSSGNFCSRHFT